MTNKLEQFRIKCHQVHYDLLYHLYMFRPLKGHLQGVYQKLYKYYKCNGILPAEAFNVRDITLSS
jgi:hypothetical protein